MVSSTTNSGAVIQPSEVSAKPLTPLTHLQSRWANLPAKNRMALFAAIPILLAVVISLFLLAGKTEYKVLFAGINDEDGGKIVEALKQLNVSYKYNETGTAILVPSDKVYDTRLALAGQGLPKQTGMGFEVMDQQKMGVTQFQEQVNYQRALEGELIRSIQSMEAVKSARVHLAIPKPSIFIREHQVPGAAVMLTLWGGRGLSKTQVNSIVHLVSSSLPSLSPDNVSVMDQHGRLLTDSDKSPEAGGAASQLSHVQQIESTLASRVIEILSPMFGASNVKATVTADVDFSRRESTVEEFKPNGDPSMATFRSQQINESQDADSKNPSGVPGVLSNVPPGQASAQIGANPQTNLSGANNQASSSSLRKESTINYEVDKNVTVIQSQVGKLTRISAAVVVNNKIIADANGQAREVPLTPEELAQVKSLVRQAIGFVEERGDKIDVVNQVFSKPELTEPAYNPPTDWQGIAKSIGLPLGAALAMAIIVFGLLRPLMAPPKPFDGLDTAGAAGDDLLPTNGTHTGRLLAVAGEGETRAELMNTEPRRLALVESEVDLAHLARMQEIARENPEVIASVLKDWVAESRQAIETKALQ